MARRSEECHWCTTACLVAVVLVGWFGFVHGTARPDHLRVRAEIAAGQDLATAGFGWARLRSQGDTAELVGEAPSEAARAAVYAAADQLLARYIGLPGVYRELDKKVLVQPAAPAGLPTLGARPEALIRTNQPPVQPLNQPLDHPLNQPIDLPPTSAGPSSPAPAALPAQAGATVPTAPAAMATGAAPPSSAEVRLPGALTTATATLAAGAAAAAGAAPAAAAAPTRPDPACQRDLAQLQRSTPLRFKPAAATLDVGQDDALVSLAGLLKRCPAGRVLVHGLRETALALAPPDAAASAVGGDPLAEPPMGSLLLAQRRAQAVRVELIAQGVAISRLQIGAGAREVMGDTPARVELTLTAADRP
jgi:outer membrane protein OmpA-like peptidoglycan-associated protein